MVLLTAFLCIALAFVQIDSRALFLEPTGEVYNEDKYFVVLQKNITDQARLKHMLTVTDRAASFGAEAKFDVQREFTIGRSFRAYTTIMCQTMLGHVLEMPEVRYVARDQVASLAQGGNCLTQTEAEWGLARTSRCVLDIDGNYQYLEGVDGSGVDAYVIDTGIYVNHVEFEGRASSGADFIYNDPSRPDGNGHGTHVASTIIGQRYGMAKKGTAIGVRVLDDNGSGSYDAVVAGVEWVADQRQEKERTTLGNMSLGGSRYEPLDDAIIAAAEAGVVMVVAAGNEGTDACLRSPAASEGAITVGATDNTDTLASFSNEGPCVEIYCPGVGITGAWIGSPTSINTISGTSMASPHVAGIVAKYLTTNSTSTPEEVEIWVKEHANKDRITGFRNLQSINSLCFMSCTDTDCSSPPPL